MSAHSYARSIPAAPVGGPLVTRAMVFIATLAGLGLVAIVLRFVLGLGATTALNDGYPWGLWIAFDVVTGTAIACGGYAMALVVYIMNRGRYHPLVRSALLISAFGYTMAGVSVVIDVGRYWSLWKVPLYFWRWNVNSVLLEVALCIMAYTFVVWVELSPAFFERGTTASWPRIRTLSIRALPIINRALVWIIPLGLLLPTMHQSSLGSLMLLSGPRLHSLWNTPLLPLLFLVSCIGMGFAAVVLEAAIGSLLMKRPAERVMLAAIGRALIPVFLLYVVLRVSDIAWRGELARLFAFDKFSVLTLVELGLAVAAPLMLVSERRRRDLGNLVRAAMLLIVAGSLYRFDTFLVAFRPGEQWSYFPSIGEILVSAGLVSLELLGYIVIVKFFPILTGHATPTPRTRPAAA